MHYLLLQVDVVIKTSLFCNSVGIYYWLNFNIFEDFFYEILLEELSNQCVFSVVMLHTQVIQQIFCVDLQRADTFEDNEQQQDQLCSLLHA